MYALYAHEIVENVEPPLTSSWFCIISSPDISVGVHGHFIKLVTKCCYSSFGFL